MAGHSFDWKWTVIEVNSIFINCTQFLKCAGYWFTFHKFYVKSELGIKQVSKKVHFIVIDRKIEALSKIRMIIKIKIYETQEK